MASNIVRTPGEMIRRHEIELVEANNLDDGTKELVYELQNDVGRMSLIQIYRLPAE